MTATLHVNNLKIGYKVGGKDKVVAGPINATLNSGELVCIMGSNGVGKSTFIRTIAGMQEPISGAIAINGNNINTVSNQEKAKLLAVVLTGRAASHYMTVFELVALGRYPHTNWKNTLSEDDKIAVKHALEAVGLNHEKERLVAELSDGNAQKAMIARALAQDTQLIILDEPTVHLDLRNKIMILQLLTDLSKEYDKSILLASHDINMMAQVADKIWLFDEEKIIAGIPEDLMNSGMIKRVLGSEEFNKSGHRSNEEPTTYVVAVSGHKKAAYWLSKALKRKGIAIKDSADIVVEANQESFTIHYKDKNTNHNTIEDALSALEVLLDE